MDLHSITPVILTFNEESNISRTLSALDWAKDIVVVDSESTDRTVDLAKGYPNVRVFERPFDTHANQWNFAIDDCRIETEWILSLDADYFVTAELVKELSVLAVPPQIAAYETKFVYCVAGRPLRGSVYPPVTTLFRRGRGSYQQDGHTQRVAIMGQVGMLKARMLHDDRKPLSRWLNAQNRYMELEAAKLASSPSNSLSLPDRIRKLVFVAPLLVLVYALVVKGTILDGRAGWYYALQRSIAEMILSVHLLHKKLF